jgi:hypothetical protein
MKAPKLAIRKSFGLCFQRLTTISNSVSWRLEIHLLAEFYFVRGLAEEMGSELLIARFLKKTERVLACFVRLSKSNPA